MSLAATKKRGLVGDCGYGPLSFYRTVTTNHAVFLLTTILRNKLKNQPLWTGSLVWWEIVDSNHRSQ